MANSVTTAPGGSSLATGTDNVVQIENLRVQFRTQVGVVNALNGVSFSIPRGKVLGVVGESGCGKSITGLSIMQLIPRPGKVISGQILLRPTPASDPIDVFKYGRNSPEMRHIRGKNVSMIFQEPMTSLNPCYTVGNQIVEAIL